MLYSLDGQYPAPLPFRYRLPDGMTRTALNELSTEELATLGFVPVEDPPVPSATQKVVWEDGDWALVDKTLAEIEAEIEAAWNTLRAERDRRLSATDFRMVSDAPWPTAPWATYRQALRDLPENTTDPLAPVWPTPPA
jgi:hypothetical protein